MSEPSTAITGASQHLTRVKVEIGTELFARIMIHSSREAGIAEPSSRINETINECWFDCRVCGAIILRADWGCLQNFL